jgi:topoisomerase-4 subunit B
LDNPAGRSPCSHGKKIRVTLHADALFIEDDGRGIPFGLHPGRKRRWLVVFTRPHAGGKFDKGKGGAWRSFSGGLHGVKSVTNSCRGASKWTSSAKVPSPWRFARCDRSVGGAQQQRATVSGTTVRAWPDGKYQPTAFDGRR